MLNFKQFLSEQKLSYIDYFASFSFPINEELEEVTQDDFDLIESLTKFGIDNFGTGFTNINSDAFIDLLEEKTWKDVDSPIQKFLFKQFGKVAKIGLKDGEEQVKTKAGNTIKVKKKRYKGIKGLIGKAGRKVQSWFGKRIRKKSTKFPYTMGGSRGKVKFKKLFDKVKDKYNAKGDELIFQALDTYIRSIKKDGDPNSYISKLYVKLLKELSIFNINYNAIQYLKKSGLDLKKYKLEDFIKEKESIVLKQTTRNAEARARSIRKLGDSTRRATKDIEGLLKGSSTKVYSDNIKEFKKQKTEDYNNIVFLLDNLIKDIKSLETKIITNYKISRLKEAIYIKKRIKKLHGLAGTTWSNWGREVINKKEYRDKSVWSELVTSKYKRLDLYRKDYEHIKNIEEQLIERLNKK